MLGLGLILESNMVAGQDDENPLKMSRSIENVGERQYEVTVNIEKGDIGGFAKLQEDIPSGFTATEIETAGSNFLFKERKAKFIWMAIPSDSKFMVKYKLIQKKTIPGDYTINGNFSCVDGQDRLRAEEESSFSVEAPKEIAATTDEDEKSTGEKGTTGDKDDDTSEEGMDDGTGSTESSGSTETSDEKSSTGDEGTETDSGKEGSEESGMEEEKTESEKESTEETEQGDDQDDVAMENGSEETSEEKDENNSGSGDSDPKEKTSPSTSTSQGVSFGVQVGAFSQPKSKSYFRSSYGISGNIRSYKEGGLNKYSVGDFSSYQEANNMKKKLRGQGVNGAFVVAFKNGKPVNVSEVR